MLQFLQRGAPNEPAKPKQRTIAGSWCQGSTQECSAALHTSGIPHRLITDRLGRAFGIFAMTLSAESRKPDAFHHSRPRRLARFCTCSSGTRRTSHVPYQVEPQLMTSVGRTHLARPAERPPPLIHKLRKCVGICYGGPPWLLKPFPACAARRRMPLVSSGVFVQRLSLRDPSQRRNMECILVFGSLPKRATHQSQRIRGTHAGSLARRTKHQTGRPTRAGPRTPPNVPRTSPGALRSVFIISNREISNWVSNPNK